MKHIFLTAALILFLGLTALLVNRWNTLNAEELAFKELADQVDEKKQEKETGDGDTGYSKAALYKAGIKEEVNRTIGEGQERERRENEIRTKDNQERDILPEYQELALENPDFAGWIAIDKTAVNYPVMQTPEEPEFYLHRDFKGRDSYAGTPFAGTVSLQAESGDLFVYGHNMKNGTMFADLFGYLQNDFQDSHPVIRFDNRYEHRTYRVCSVFQAEETEWSREGGLFSDAGFMDGREREDFLREIQKRGGKEADERIEDKASLLFLVTCSYGKENSRLVVAAVRENDGGKRE